MQLLPNRRTASPLFRITHLPRPPFFLSPLSPLPIPDSQRPRPCPHHAPWGDVPQVCLRVSAFCLPPPFFSPSLCWRRNAQLSWSRLRLGCARRPVDHAVQAALALDPPSGPPAPPPFFCPSFAPHPPLDSTRGKNQGMDGHVSGRGRKHGWVAWAGRNAQMHVWLSDWLTLLHDFAFGWSIGTALVCYGSFRRLFLPFYTACVCRS